VCVGDGERADAARNRRAILRAAERLLAEHGPAYVSLDRVAAEAGVGKGTVFRRFGDRMGLMRAVLEERADSLREAVLAGPPPLGPGAPPRDRLVAFLDAVVALAARNIGVMTAQEHQAGQEQHRSGASREHPVYRFWHGHVSELIAAARPELDAGALGHVLLSSLHADLLRTGESDRLAAGLRALVDGLLGGGRTGDQKIANQPRQSNPATKQ
jgi:AcrR family transcriptional regulator